MHANPLAHASPGTDAASDAEPREAVSDGDAGGSGGGSGEACDARAFTPKTRMRTLSQSVRGEEVARTRSAPQLPCLLSAYPESLLADSPHQSPPTIVDVPPRASTAMDSMAMYGALPSPPSVLHCSRFS